MLYTSNKINAYIRELGNQRKLDTCNGETSDGETITFTTNDYYW